MKFALFVGLTFFCSLWTAGSFLQCSTCSSTDSYEDCQNKLKVQNCTADRACFQAEIKYENESKKEQAFSKGCLAKSLCEDYEKGEIGVCVSLRKEGYTVDCKGKCCHEDECNKENLLSKDSFLQCSFCESEDSYEDCQDKVKVINCTAADRVCFQAEVKYEKDSEKKQAFSKGCLAKSFCEDYEKGEIGDCLTLEGQGYTVDCKGKCCHEDECNKENLLSKGSAFIISVLVLMSGLFLTLININ